MSVVLLPFDKTAALAGDPVIIAAGTRCYDLTELTTADANQKLVGTIEGVVYTFSETGANSQKKEYNLYMAGVTKSVWINVYYDEPTDTITISEIFGSELDALSTITDPTTYVKTQEITNQAPEE